jgi:uncharacterized damage-inducible protein DinB
MNALEKYPQMEAQLEQTIQALEGVGQEELDCKPLQHEKVRSIGDIMRHIVQAEDTFINRFVMGQEVQPRTPQTNPTTESLVNDFKSLRGRTLERMRQWQEADLQKTYTGPRGMQMSLDRILQILVGHEIGHRSQMLMIRRLKNPDR